MISTLTYLRTCVQTLAAELSRRLFPPPALATVDPGPDPRHARFTQGYPCSPPIKNQKSKIKNFLCLLALAPTLALAQDAGPTVTTDQSDYPPGSTVYITGSG